jgi:hypothetical protein
MRYFPARVMCAGCARDTSIEAIDACGFCGTCAARARAKAAYGDRVKPLESFSALPARGR